MQECLVCLIRHHVFYYKDTDVPEKRSAAIFNVNVCMWLRAIRRKVLRKSAV